MSSSSEMGQTFVAPPGVPAHIVQALRRAFDATVKDPDYLAMMQKAGNALNPMGGEELTQNRRQNHGHAAEHHRALQGGGDHTALVVGKAELKDTLKGKRR